MSKFGTNVLKKMLRKIVQYEGEGKLAYNKKLLAALLYGHLCGQQHFMEIARATYGTPERMKWKASEDTESPESQTVVNKETANTLKDIYKLLDGEQNESSNTSSG